jgi:hybrid cluster-associated redox disulfide protein
MRKASLIEKEMLVSEVVKKYPETVALFLEKGLHCIGCNFAKDETIEEAAKLHQIDLEELIKSLNKAIEK